MDTFVNGRNETPFDVAERDAPGSQSRVVAQLCRWFDVPRSSFYYTTRRRGPGMVDAALTTLVREIIDDWPKQNGMVERFFKTLKAECVWLNRFRDRDHAFAVISAWLDHYDAERPHSPVGYLTPRGHREELAA